MGYTPLPLWPLVGASPGSILSSIHPVRPRPTSKSVSREIKRVPAGLPPAPKIESYQAAPFNLVRLTSRSPKLSAALPSPDRVLCTAVQNWLETSLYLTLAGAD